MSNLFGWFEMQLTAGKPLNSKLFRRTNWSNRWAAN